MNSLNHCEEDVVKTFVSECINKLLTIATKPENIVKVVNDFISEQ